MGKTGNKEERRDNVGGGERSRREQERKRWEAVRLKSEMGRGSRDEGMGYRMKGGRKEEE